MAAALAVFAFSPGSALAAPALSVTQTSNTNCAANHFEWSFSLGGLSAGETVGVEALFGSDYYFQTFPFTTDGTTIKTSDVHSFGGSATDTLTWTLYTSSFEMISTGTVTPNCAPAMPTSKSQCSGSGWTAFPAFKNRGQCTAFVERGGK
jgi:hypothetical protein